MKPMRFLNLQPLTIHNILSIQCRAGAHGSAHFSYVNKFTIQKITMGNEQFHISKRSNNGDVANTSLPIPFGE